VGKCYSPSSHKSSKLGSAWGASNTKEQRTKTQRRDGEGGGRCWDGSLCNKPMSPT
jgi:hypothetical protein